MAVIAAFMIVDVGNVAHRISLQSHIAGSPTVVINDQLGHYYQLAHRKRDRAEFDGWPANLMEYTRANIGIVREGVDSEFREYAQGHLRIHPRDEVNYVGEFSQHGTPVTPAYWSPNHIKFDDLDPNVPLLVNLNRGSPWFNFGRQLYPNDKIVNFVDPFIVMPDVKGRVDLWYISPHTDAAWFATALGVAVLSVSCLILHRSDKSNDPTP